MGTTEGDHYSH